MSPSPRYRRVLVKLSGEALMDGQKFGIELSACQRLASEISLVLSLGVQLGIVIGGGNIFRGRLAEEFGFKRTPADHIGMLATAINGMILQQVLATSGVRSHVMSSFNTDSMIEFYVWQQAIHYLESGRVVIFVGGTGNPYFTTDTAAALRASEIEAEVLIKGTKVDGVYDLDPAVNPKAKILESTTYSEVFAKNLQVMDSAAVALCRDNRIKIHVINIFKPGALYGAICGQSGGSLITGE